VTPVIRISGGKLEVITADIDGPKAWSINTKALASDELHAYSLMSVHLTSNQLCCLCKCAHLIIV